ncbi:MAG: matrixin family metalloprotease, partial [Deltaproteobacteria bacterium]|nr:matrixin family metalloprotease [Deltaproteobacteria bacterium]
MVHHGLTAITSLFLLISLCSSSAEAYALRKAPAGQVLVWSQRAVTVELDGRQLPGAPGAADAVRAAFATWSSAGAPVAVTLQESKTIADGSQDGKNTIRFEHKRWDYGHEVIGLTLATYYAQSGLVFETDIVFDAVNRQWSTSANTPSKHFDVQNIAAHEAGHFFGLGHSQHTDATMFAESLPGERDKRTLSPDDRAGLAAIVAEMDRRIGAKAQLPPPKADQVVEREVYSPLPARTQIGCNVSGAETHAP